MEQNFIEDNLIIISLQTYKMFLKEKNPADLIALYLFYYYTAKWQKTNQPKCTNGYVRQAFGWGRDKMFNAQNRLLDLGIIEKVVTKNKFGVIDGWFIKLNYLWKNETFNEKEFNVLSHMSVFPQVDQPTCGKKDTSALSDSNINALSDGNKITCAKMSFEDFEAFWKEYPIKKAKKPTEQKFLKLPQSLFPKIIQAVKAQKQSEQWKRGFIPHPLTWINQARWEDEATVAELSLEEVAQKMVRECLDKYGEDGNIIALSRFQDKYFPNNDQGINKYMAIFKF